MCSKRAVKRGPQEIFASHVKRVNLARVDHMLKGYRSGGGCQWLLLHLQAICMRSCGCNDHLNHLHFHHIPMTFKLIFQCSNDQFQHDTAMPNLCGTSQEIFGQRISDHVPQEFTFAPEGSEGSGIQVLSWNIMARALCRRPGPPGGRHQLASVGRDQAIRVWV